MVQEVAKGFAVTAGIDTKGVAVSAQETLLLALVPGDTETVVIDTKTYTWQTTLTNVDGNVLIGATVTESRDNLAAAINKDAGAGTRYAALMTLHPTVEARPNGTDDLDAVAKTPGVAGNSIAISETMVGVGNEWTASATTLSGGLAGQLWRTPELLGANTGFELMTESIEFDVQLINSDGATGVRSRVSGDRGNEFHSGDVGIDLQYRGAEVFLGLAFGDVTTVNVSGNTYKHTFKPATSLTGLMGTLVIDKQISVWEYPSVKIGNITISGAAGEITTVTATIVASNLNRNKYLGVNNLTTIGTITIPTDRQFILFEDLTVHLVDQSEASFTDTDLIYPSAFEISMNSNMATDQVTTKYKREIDEATEDGFFDVEGSLTFPVYETERIVNVAQLKEPLAMRWRFLGNTLISGETNYPEFNMYMPEVKFGTASPNVGGPGRVGYQAPFTAAKASADPSSFPATYGAAALVIDLINGLTTNPIASV